MTVVTLNGKRVLCSGVTLSGKKNVDVKPNANIDGPVEVQTLAYENLNIMLNQVNFVYDSTSLADTTLFQYSDLIDMYKHKYTGSNAYSLKVVFGKTDALLTGTDTSNTVDIPVILKTFNFPISTRSTYKGYVPTADITLVETK